MSALRESRWLATSWSATSFARAIAPAAAVTVTGAPDQTAPPVQISGNDAVVNGPAFLEGLHPPLMKRLIDRLTAPALSGAILHCCALWTTPPPLQPPSNPPTPTRAAVAYMLWAPRAEAELIQSRPYDRLFFRAYAINDATARDPLTGSLSIYARAHAGVFPTRIGQQAIAAALETTDKATVTALVDICHEVSELAKDDADGLEDLVRRWLEIVTARTAANHPGGTVAADMLATSAMEINAEAAAMSLAQPAPATNRADDVDGGSNGVSASKIFHNSEPLSGRKPTPADLRYRDALVTRLRRIQIKAPHRTTAPATYPGIRLASTKLVQQRAQRTFRMPVTATPWQVIRYDSTPRPPLHCGLAIDASPSNAAWLSTAGVAAWAMAAATHSLGGRCAAATFGGEVRPLIRPSSPPLEIPIAKSAPSSSGCSEAITATEHVLDLNH